jgi:hypothetical protein
LVRGQGQGQAGFRFRGGVRSDPPTATPRGPTAARLRLNRVLALYANGSSTQGAVELRSLLDCLDGEWLKLPWAVVRASGPAAQTLGGLMKITNRETFVSIATIAKAARIPARTVKRHLKTLIAAGWVESRGRERTRAGHSRRTNTLIVTSRTKEEAKAAFGILPWWACSRNITPSVKLPRNRWSKPGSLTWGSKVLLGLVMAKLMAMKAGAAKQFEGNGFAHEDWIDTFGGPERFRFALQFIEQETGLDHKTATAAKRQLMECGIIDWSGSPARPGEALRRGEGDYLTPRVDQFAVEVKHVSDTTCYLRLLKNGLEGRQ